LQLGFSYLSLLKGRAIQMKTKMRIGALLVILGVAFTGAIHGQAPAYPPVIQDALVETYKTIDGVELKVWILQPDGDVASNSSPAMLFFFGGGWVSGSPGHFFRQAQVLKSRGIVSILVDYRVESRHNTLPEDAVEDAKSAVRWVREHASDYGIDPLRIGAAGGSSGGHLAASTATVPGFDRPSEQQSISSVPNALILFNPVVIIAPVEGIWELPDNLREVIGHTEHIDISPYHHVANGTPPTIIFHGTEDPLVPYSTVLAYCDLVVKSGSKCSLDSYQGAAHGFFNTSPYYEETIIEMQRFLETLGWIGKQ
jgi:acetyl esterase/lipase